MADTGELTVTGSGRAHRLGLAWWGKVVVVFVASRIITTGIMLAFAALQPKTPLTPASPNYFDFASIWDAGWYRAIALSGYPTQLPVNADGHVVENAWAFMPVYPALVRLLMTITSLDFAVVAVILSLIFALGAALVLYRLMNLVLPENTALFAVVLFCVAPLSPILQVAYAEPLQLFLLALALYLLLTRRYWLMLPVIAVLALTKPGELALALVMGLHVVYRFWLSRPARKDPQPFPLADRVAAIVVTVFSGVMGIAWVIVAGVATGVVNAYTQTELAWRSHVLGYKDFVPFTPWIEGVTLRALKFGIPLPVGYALLALGIIALFAALFLPQVRRLGPDLRFWLASYMLYLLAVLYPQTSLFRLLVPLFPALGALAQPTSRVYRVIIVILSIAGQVLWVYACWWVGPDDSTPP